MRPVESAAAIPADVPEAGEAVAAVAPLNRAVGTNASNAALSDDSAPFDEAAEAAFLAEARDRGEVVATAKIAADVVEEVVDSKALPPLDELVKRIPPEVRETLEDLFRAKFVAVRRVPAKALKE